MVIHAVLFINRKLSIQEHKLSLCKWCSRSKAIPVMDEVMDKQCNMVMMMKQIQKTTVDLSGTKTRNWP